MIRLSATEYRKQFASRKRRHKYGAKAAWRCASCMADVPGGGACLACGMTDVIRFDSRREAARWDELHLMETLGAITELRRQVPFPIEVGGRVISIYYADFSYVREGKRVVEDVKGGRATDTPLSRIKRKAVEAGHGIRIEVIR